MTPFWFKCRFFAMSLDCDGGTNILWIYQPPSIFLNSFVMACLEKIFWVTEKSGDFASVTFLSCLPVVSNIFVSAIFTFFAWFLPNFQPGRTVWHNCLELQLGLQNTIGPPDPENFFLSEQRTGLNFDRKK